MNMEIDEVVLKSDRSQRTPMSDERLLMVMKFVAGIIAEVLGFGLAFVIVLCMARVL